MPQPRAPERPDLALRARRHAALGDPTRLALVDDLVLSDRSPTELASRFELASNLLSHHLDVLEAAGLVERLTSSGDRRRRYVRLVPTALDDLALGRRLRPRRTVFVCSRNSARSQLAAALWTAQTGSPASSAGTDPADRVHPGAVAAADRIGLDLGDSRPRRLTPDDEHALVITVCDRAHEELRPRPEWLHWSLPDPVVDGSNDAFDATIELLRRRIDASTAPANDTANDTTHASLTDSTQETLP